MPTYVGNTIAIKEEYQVLDNLAGDALKFTPVSGTISIHLKEKRESWVVFAVADSAGQASCLRKSLSLRSAGRLIPS
jgi:hypothetical protein